MATIEERLRELDALESANGAPLPSRAPTRITVNPMSNREQEQGLTDVPLPETNTPYSDEATAKRNSDLDARLQEVTSQMDAAGEIYVPEEVEKVFPEVGAVPNFLRRMNRDLADSLGIIPEAANEILDMIGLGLWNPGDRKSMMAAREMFRSAGINVDPVEGLSSKIGHETFVGLATLAPILKAGPLLEKAGSSLVQEIGRIFQHRPGLQLALTPGAATGGVLAEEYAADMQGEHNAYSRAAAIPGAIAGTGVQSMVHGTVAKVGRGVAQVGDKLKTIGQEVLSDFGIGKPPVKSTPTVPLRDPNITPGMTRPFAEQQVEGAKRLMDMAIFRAMNRIKSANTPEEANQFAHKYMATAERIGNRIVGDYWSRTPLKSPVPMNELRQNIDLLKFDVRDDLRNAPKKFHDLADGLKELGSPVRLPDGKMAKSIPSIQKLRSYRSLIRDERVSEEAAGVRGAPVRDGYVRNLLRLEALIDDAITKAYPADNSIKAAREMSIKYNDLFNRGPIADATAMRGRGDPVVPPEQFVEFLLKKFQGIEALVNVRNELKTVPGPGKVISPAATPQERAELDGLVKAAEDSIRAMFREVADTKGPEAAIKFTQKIERSIRPLSKVHGEMEWVGNKLTKLLDEQKAFEKSTLAKYAQMDTQKAISRIYASPDPLKATKELMTTFNKDPDALAGFRTGMLDEYLTRARFDPERMKAILQTPRFQDTMREVLDPTQYARLEKIVEITSRIQRGDEKNIRALLAPAATIWGRILGAGAGRQIAGMTGGGTVQTPGIVANAFGKATEKMFRQTDPQTMMVQAILDPKWERLLLSRAPHTTKMARDTMKAARRIIGGVEGTREALFRDLESEDE